MTRKVATDGQIKQSKDRGGLLPGSAEDYNTRDEWEAALVARIEEQSAQLAVYQQDCPACGTQGSLTCVCGKAQTIWEW